MRAAYLDALRGLAVIWMVIFHTAYDMKILGFIDWNFGSGFWYGFPRFIAFTFLFCVGVSLYYTHSSGVKLKPLLKRSLRLGAAAFAVSIGTYFVFPAQWVFFGTLHCILVGSILGAFVAPHKIMSWIIMILILTGQYILSYDIKWVSLTIHKPSMDFIPIYPWFWCILLGLNLAPYLSRITLINQIQPQPCLNFLGQHSLKIYLIHQPVIFGTLWAIRQFV